MTITRKGERSKHGRHGEQDSRKVDRMAQKARTHRQRDRGVHRVHHNRKRKGRLSSRPKHTNGAEQNPPLIKKNTINLFINQATREVGKGKRKEYNPNHVEAPEMRLPYESSKRTDTQCLLSHMTWGMEKGKSWMGSTGTGSAGSIRT